VAGLATMRMIGPVGSYRELGVQDHLCWVHGDRRDYRPRLSDFFRDGLERGLRVAHLGSEDAGELRELLGRVVDTGTLLPRKAVRVISFEEFYGAAEPVDPAAVIKRYDAATQEALADGYRGLRVSADVTDLVRAPERRDAFARCEVLLERYSARRPLSAMCGYRRELGDAVTQFACLHAAVPAGLTPFQVFACDDGAVGLFGEFDQACQVAFERALRRIEPTPDDPELIFDMSAVRFIDHHALLALDSYAEACQVPVLARSVPPAVRRVARVLGLEPLGHVHLGGL
jgi:anti-anti-sigma regulatory factor